MRKATRVLSSGALAALLTACGGGELTELFVVVDSDLPNPSEIDAVRVEITGAGTASASGALTGPGAMFLPRTLGVVHRGGSLGPLRVEVVGSLGGAEVVRARAITSFVRGRTLVLPMFLSRLCRERACPDGQTCIAGACASADVDSASLIDWNGTVPRLDGGACTPSEERCNGVDDDCDGRIDETFDLRSDALHCGACNNACARTGASTACVSGACTITGCDAGLGNCDGDVANGCEASFATDALHCGRCDNACSFPNAEASCVASTCTAGPCLDGYGDCDASPGCEAPLDTLTDCGACGLACSVPSGTATCATRTCAVDTCDAGLGDCNLDPVDGCELALDTLTDCAACGVACTVTNGTPICVTGACTVASCNAGFDDCNASAADGCEQGLVTVAHCGACDVPCTVPSGTPTCETGVCLVGECPANFGDCNGIASDGCEVDLRRNDAHCAACDVVCTGGLTCHVSGVCR